MHANQRLLAITKLVPCGLGLLGLLLSGCAGASDEAKDEAIGNAALAVVQVPSGVSCLRVTATGSTGSTVVRTLDVTGGTAFSGTLTGLPLGLTTFVGEAFDSACSAVTNLTVADWTADAVTATTSVATPPKLCLVFQPNGRTQVCADFETTTVSSVTWTSVTLDPEGSTGITTDAPGAWSSSTGDPLSQVGVLYDGAFLNNGATSGNLGEISIPLNYGISTYTLVGDGVFAGNLFYGAVLFFNGVATPPQIAVYNANAGTGAFSVQAAGATIMGGANGGGFFDVAPGTAVFTAKDGTRVQVLDYTIDATTGPQDLVSWGGIGANGTPDTIATLTLKVSPPNCP